VPWFSLSHFFSFFLDQLSLLLQNDMPNSRSSKKPKLGSASDANYCVLQTGDGGRIMTVVAATEFVENSSVASRKEYVCHFAGSLKAAEDMLKTIEQKMKPNGIGEYFIIVVFHYELLSNVLYYCIVA